MRAPAKSFRDLIVWQKGRRAAALLYSITRLFPKEEMYGLTSQIRRGAVSIPSNIAEGFGRRGQPEFLRFLLITRGSIFELETQLQIALDVGLLGERDYERAASAVDEIERLLESLIEKVESRIRG